MRSSEIPWKGWGLSRKTKTQVRTPSLISCVALGRSLHLILLFFTSKIIPTPQSCLAQMSHGEGSRWESTIKCTLLLLYQQSWGFCGPMWQLSDSLDIWDTQINQKLQWFGLSSGPCSPQTIYKLSYLGWSPDYLSAGRDGGRTLSSSRSANEQIEAQKCPELSQGCVAWVWIPGLPLNSLTWESYLTSPFASISSSPDNSNATCLVGQHM